jgi:hypothetical protein
MEKIKLKYDYCFNTLSDINEHLPILLNYAKECEHITEMGIRWVTSTWAFLLSNPKKIIGYDILKHDNLNEVIELSKIYDIDYFFFESDVLDIEIEPTDLLFIDTLHTYNQLTLELDLHSKNVKKYIILHDTVTYGLNDEIIYENSSINIKNKKIEKTGLINAVNDFLKSENGNSWYVLKEYKNNNGLMILKKI